MPLTKFGANFPPAKAGGKGGTMSLLFLLQKYLMGFVIKFVFLGVWGVAIISPICATFGWLLFFVLNRGEIHRMPLFKGLIGDFIASFFL